MKLNQILMVSSLFALCACGSDSVKDTLGITRKAPDEFKVVARPPLSVPPQFNLLPPSNSAESPTMLPADKKAQSLLLGKPIENNDKATSSESQFLKNIKADKADPKVRDTLVQQKNDAQEKKEESSWWNGFSGTEKKEGLVDAKAEAERLKTNKAAGKAVTEGETPETKDKDRGVLRDWLGW